MYKLSAVILFFVYMLLTSYANSDLLLGGRFLFMDEQVSFDGVYRILHSENWESFFFEITDGREYRYGRIFWNVSALFSWIPSLIFDEPGQIFATRMTSAVLQAVSYFILTETFVKRNFQKIFCFAVLLFLPFSGYYATMPKPEPLQLFLLSLFFHYGFKSRFRNPYIWILWGMSFGAKISTLVTLPVCGLLFLHSHFRKMQELRFYLKAFSILLFILLGLCISVPILFKLDYEPWIQYTFKNTTQGDDSDTVNLLTWFRYSIEVLWNSPVYLVTAVYVIYFISIIQNSSMILLRTSDSRKKTAAFFLTVLFFISIAMGVKRIWGFYMHFFTVFFIISLFQCVDFRFSAGWFRKFFFYSDFLSGLKDAGILVLLSVLLLINFNKSRIYYQVMAERTKAEEFRLGYARYQGIRELLEKKQVEKNSVMFVAIDPFLFDQKEVKERFIFEKFWGPFFGWDRKYDFVIIGDYFFALTEVKNKRYFETAESILERDRHLIFEEKKGCAKKPCYRELKRIEGLRVFSLADVE